MKRDRHSLRLKGYDYSGAGFYFVTVCTKNRGCVLGEVIDGRMAINGSGNIVKKCWEWLAQQFPYVRLDEWVIMPDHLHGIIFVGAGLAPAPHDVHWATARVAPTIGEIIGSFKSLCVVEWLKYITRNNINEIGKIWQRNYFERIIRNKKELNQKRQYIRNNPLKHKLEKNNSIKYKI